MTIVSALLVALCLWSPWHDNPILTMADPQVDSKPASIEERISNTTPQRARRVRIVEEGWPSGRLTTAVGRHKYFIDHIQGNGAGTLPKPIVDPTGSYIAYATGTGCGYEGDGMMAFISDVFGKKRYPILGGAPEKFLQYKGKVYLLLADGNGASNEENSLWLYDVGAKEFVVHAKGDLAEIREGVFSYGYYPQGDEIKPVGTVTIKNLVNRERPLLLLPRSSPGLMRHPRYRLTRRGNTTMLLASGDNECCWCCQAGKRNVIPKAKTRVLILGTCDDGGLQVYYNRQMGKVRKRDLQSMK